MMVFLAIGLGVVFFIGLVKLNVSHARFRRAEALRRHRLSQAEIDQEDFEEQCEIHW